MGFIFKIKYLYINYKIVNFKLYCVKQMIQAKQYIIHIKINDVQTKYKTSINVKK